MTGRARSARCGRAARALLWGALLLTASPAGAHTRSVSYSIWELDAEGATVTLRIPQLELTRLPWGIVDGPRLVPELALYLTDRLQLLSDAESCPLRGAPRVLVTPPDRAAIEWRVECPQEGARAIRSHLLQEVAPSHLHFARVRSPQDALVERVLTTADPTWPLESASDAGTRASAGSSLASYVAIGMEHIGTGPDHLAFVLALILIAASLGEVATVITGFTLSHSLTLAVAVLGWARPEAESIGALVGLSIALVAAENVFLLCGRPRAIGWLISGALAAVALLGACGIGGLGVATAAGMALFVFCYFGLLGRSERPARLRVAIAFVFGLVHGFGFGRAFVLPDRA